MCRNNKNARRIAERKAWSAIRKSGGSGPKSTTPKHGKVNRQPHNKPAPKQKDNTASVG